MAQLRCCGGRCPQSSNCAAETFLLFPPLEDERLGEIDRFNLPQAEYFENVVRLNYTWLMGKPGAGCYERLHADLLPSPPSPADEVGSLFSDGGEVMVTLAQAEPGEPGAAAYHSFEWLLQLMDGEVAASNETAPQLLDQAVRPDKWRLAQLDAQRLIADVRPDYGLSTSARPGFVTVDVVGGPGVPRLKFVYVTEPAFVALLPSDLLLLSAGLLSADVLQERVRLLSTGCPLWDRSQALPSVDELADAIDEAQANASALSARDDFTLRLVIDAHEQVRKSLAGAQELRGELLLLGDAVDGWGRPTVYHLPSCALAADCVGDNDRSLEAWGESYTRDSLLVAVSLATAFGAVAGALLTIALLRVLHTIQVSVYRTKVRAATLQLQYAGLSARAARHFLFAARPAREACYGLSRGPCPNPGTLGTCSKGWARSCPSRREASPPSSTRCSCCSTTSPSSRSASTFSPARAASAPSCPPTCGGQTRARRSPPSKTFTRCTSSSARRTRSTPSRRTSCCARSASTAGWAPVAEA
mmetsp:Transcript_41129/g.133338  ORF Transcript_41129/g.133338 Transcript_41129/m.133338 type:complete len:530 (-) Transcript_41129:478-2067(-)